MIIRSVLAILLSASISTTFAETPLPEDINIIVPTPDTPQSISAFSGKWTGQWANTLDHTLIVERVEERKITLVYSFGVAPTWGIHSSGHLRTTGIVADDGSLRATLPNGAEVTYRLSTDQKTIFGEFLLKGRLTKGTLIR